MTGIKSTARRAVGAANAIAMAAVLLATASAARADSVFSGGLTYDNVQVLDVIDGELVFTTFAGVEIRQPMIKIDKIFMDKFPGLENAERHAAAEDYAKAVTAFETVSRPPAWLKHWTQYRLVAVADKAGDASTATKNYVELVRDEKAFDFYRSTPPLDSLAKADDRVKKRLATMVTDAFKSLGEKDKAHEPMKKMVALVGGESEAAQDVIAEVNAAKDTAIEMTERLNKDDPVTKMLRMGKFAEAREQLFKEMDRTQDGGSLRRLYQLGLAQRGLADKANEAGEREEARKLYLSAALSFMRVVIHFNEQSGYRGPALLEAGYAHMQLGLSEKAGELFEEASGLLKPADEHLRQRLAMLQKKLEDVN